ncbi:putative amidoligase enzyme-domain-containing protein [Xylariales sp. PMI_506]|nr:putative amidoligase enzyme-domain-containing protein [Xylariales sp. PMI_506]
MATDGLFQTWEDVKVRRGIDPLTFGIEVEMLVAYGKIAKGKLLGSPADTNSDWITSYRRDIHVRTTLEDYDLHKDVAHKVREFLVGIKLRDPVMVSNKFQSSEAVVASEEKNCRAWIIKRETTCQKTRVKLRESETHYVGIELVSPILVNDKTAFQECYKLVDALRAQRWVIMEQTCGFHVHVGCGNVGFELLTLQKFTTLMWMGGEATLNKTHPPHRLESRWCRTMRSKSSLASPEWHGDMKWLHPAGDLTLFKEWAEPVCPPAPKTPRPARSCP